MKKHAKVGTTYGIVAPPMVGSIFVFAGNRNEVSCKITVRFRYRVWNKDGADAVEQWTRRERQFPRLAAGDSNAPEAPTKVMLEGAGAVLNATQGTVIQQGDCIVQAAAVGKPAVDLRVLRRMPSY